MTKIFILACILFLSACEQKSKTRIVLDFPTGGDFTVPTTKGAFNTKEHRGKTILLFFGFTQCPHVCPTTLSNINRTMKLLPKQLASNVEVLFISVDQRDTMDVLKKRIETYSPQFFAGTDSEANLKKILDQFGARYQIIKGTDPTDVIIDHTASIFVINDKGVWVDSLEYDATPQVIAGSVQGASTSSPVFAAHRKNRVIENIAENATCDLAQTSCGLAGFNVSLGPYPIMAEKDYKVEVEGKSEKGIPLEIDFEGVEANMGYIRPKLVQAGPEDPYKGNFHIPICELPEMHWKARLIIQTPEGGLKALVFNFRTVVGK